MMREAKQTPQNSDRSGWQQKRLKFACRINPSKSEIGSVAKDLPVTFVPMERVTEDGEVRTTETRRLEDVLQGFTYFRDGDIVVAKITPCFENGKGGVCRCLVNGIGFGSTEFHVLRPLRGIDPHFIFYVTKSDAFRSGGAAFMYGAAGQQRVPEDFIRDFQTNIPESAQQQAIAAFLDRKTAQIDDLIGKKERQIELLQEKRQALISQAVTKGLDPNVPMKDSGVEWLGSVPLHWQVKKLKHFVQFLNHRRIPLSSEERADLEKLYPYYGASGIIDHVDRYLFDEPLILIGEDGANLYSRSTPLAFIATGKYWVNNHAHILKPRCGDLEFWAERLNSIAYNPFITGSAQPKLTIENLANIEFAAPPSSEQTQIGQYIGRVRQATEAPLTHLESQIDKLREYRQTLISAAVTGKIDVIEPAQCSGVSKRLLNVAEHLFVKNDTESAWLPLCTLIDATTKHVLGRTGRQAYQEFIHQRMPLITRIAFSGVEVHNMNFAIPPIHDENGKPIKPSFTHADGTGLYSIEQVIYHLIRCKMAHESQMAPMIVDSGYDHCVIEAGTDASNRLLLPLRRIAEGIFMAIMGEWNLRSELQGTVFENGAFGGVPLLDLLGDRQRIDDLSRRIAKNSGIPDAGN
jgi:type I restriction enzyme S subunit